MHIQMSKGSKPLFVHQDRLKPALTRNNIDTSWVKDIPIKSKEIRENEAESILENGSATVDRPRRQCKQPERYGNPYMY